MKSYKREFIEFMVEAGVLTFGDFITKSGRKTPFFINTGNYDTGAEMQRLGSYYAQALNDALGNNFDCLFGPAYKGIPLAVTTGIALAREFGHDVGICFNRKEAKDHGEGGTIVGARLEGQVLITDDVISAGTSVRESIEWIRQAGASPCGVAIALDRQERGQGEMSAAQEVSSEFGIPVVAIAGLDDLIDFLESRSVANIDIEAIRRYRNTYGV
jgi:orotate phosphoribosyltransferase